MLPIVGADQRESVARHVQIANRWQFDSKRLSSTFRKLKWETYVYQCLILIVFLFIHEKDVLSISSVLFIVHLRVINALKCHAGITQKYGVTSCRVFFAITCWIGFCHEWAFSQSLKTPQTSVNRGNITVSCVGVREIV